MRSPGVIYRRYRNLKKKYLYDKVLDSRKKMHNNCFYGNPMEYTDAQNRKRMIRVCRVNLALAKSKSGEDLVNNLDICNCPIVCNAFVSKYSKEAIKEEFEKELQDPVVKRLKYPELVELEWILDKSLNDAQKQPSFIGKLLISAIYLLEKLLKKVDKS